MGDSSPPQLTQPSMPEWPTTAAAAVTRKRHASDDSGDHHREHKRARAAAVIACLDTVRAMDVLTDDTTSDAFLVAGMSDAIERLVQACNDLRYATAAADSRSQTPEQCGDDDDDEPPAFFRTPNQVVVDLAS
jgi:hypothetical protein